MQKEKLISDIKKIAAACRRGEYSDVASMLNIFLSELPTYLQRGSVDPVMLKKISYSLETLFILQQQKDLVALADVLEYELVKLL